jgi:predicted ATPase
MNFGLYAQPSYDQALRVVITGAPGVGKTTLIDTLAEKGFKTLPEVATKLIKEGEVHPSRDLEAFQTEVFERTIKNFLSVEGQDKLVFFDRGLPDTIGYLKLGNKEIPPDEMERIKNHLYHNKVFIPEPWQEIYTSNGVRFEDYEQSKKLHEALLEAYLSVGYDVVIIPKNTSVEERVQFVLNNLDLSTLKLCAQ